MSTTTNQGSLDGCVYAITGGAGALGGAVARALLARGASVHVLDRVEPNATLIPAGTAAAQLSSEVLDVTDERAVTAAYARFDRLDGSIHCAGGFDMKPIVETALADFDAMWRMNTVSCFLACREAVRAMRRTRAARGWIVNVAARPAVSAVGGMVAYAASKAAVANLTVSIAAETLSEGIFVNAVLPSIMNTPTNRAAMPSADHAKWPSVDQVASVIRALASPGNEVTSGALVPVYGAV